jgi:MraZ protein
MGLFLSKFTFKIDRKGRVSVPADYRARLAGQSFNGIIALMSYTEPAIRCCGIDLMEKISASRDPMAVFQPTPVDLAVAQVPDTTPLPFDGEGRIVLPQELMAHAGITDQATFVGRLHYFEIWAPATFADHQTQMRQRIQAAGAVPGLPGAAP